METVRAYPEPYDAVIQAGYGEHGREGLQELLDVPVVDITEAAASTAMFLGHKYSVVTTLDRAVPLIEDRLKLAGLTRPVRLRTRQRDGRAGPGARPDRPPWRPSPGKRPGPSRTITPKSICLGCGGMAGLRSGSSSAPVCRWWTAWPPR